MATTTTQLTTGTWQLTPSTTKVTASARMMGLITVPAELTVTSGTVIIDENNQVTNISVQVDASSYTSSNAKRNEHVQSNDFLDAGAYPTMSFAASSLSSTATGFSAAGTVTVKGKPSPVTLAVSDVQVSGDNGSFTATATIDRKDIGVDKMPAFIIGRAVELHVSAQATKTA